MGELFIPDVPDETIRAIENKALANGRSLEQEVRFILEQNRPFTTAERVALTKRFHAETPELQPTLTTEERHEGLM